MAFATTFTVKGEVGQKGGPYPVKNINIAGDSAYAAGGNTGLAALVNSILGGTYEIVAAHGQSIADGKRCWYDVENDKLVCFVAAGTEESGTPDLSTVTYQMVLVLK
jgi:hypothetical protein